MELNPYILCAMDNRKTPDQMAENRDLSYIAAEEVHAEYDISSSYYAAFSAAYHAAYDNEALEGCLDKYFALTCESREEYEMEISKDDNNN